MHVWLFLGENVGEPCTIWICDSAAVAEQFAYRWAAAKYRKLRLIGDPSEDVYHVLRCLRAEGFHGRIEEHVVATAVDLGTQRS